MRYLLLRRLSAILSVIFLAGLPMVAQADTFISQSYSSTQSLPLDSIVSLQNNSSDQIVPANNANADNILGIVVNAQNSSLTLSNDQANQVQVATTGTLEVLVSDINGSIGQGDYITASPIDGVGMKATANARVVGIAQSALNSTTGSEQSYTDKTGKKQTVLLGEIPLLVNVSNYYKQADKTLIPSAVQSIANALAGKTVSTTPILISGGIFIVTLLVVVSIIYSMIRSSIISVGRNPMSQSAIYRDLVQLSALVLVILVGAFVAIYLVLTKL
jgi:hypothetical protein